MKAIIVILCVVALANAAVLPLGYTVTPKVPLTTNIPVITNVPVVTNVPVTVPSCGCGIEIANYCGYCGPEYVAVTPACGCSDLITVANPCSCASGLPFGPCGCSNILPINPCGCSNILPINPCGCQDMLPIGPCGCQDILPIGPCGCSNILPVSSCGCGRYSCGPSCLTVDPVTALGCTVPVVPTCGCGGGCGCNACGSLPCGCPTIPPLPPVVGCCGKYLRQICIPPPFL